MSDKVIFLPNGTKRKIRSAGNIEESSVRSLQQVLGGDPFDRSSIITGEISPKRLENIYTNAFVSGDIGSLYEFYLKIEKYDAKLGGLISKRRSAIRKYDWEIKISDEANKDNPKVQQAAEFVERTFKSEKFDLDSLRKQSMDGLLYGMKIFVKKIEKQGDMLSYRSWDEVPVSSYRQKVFNDAKTKNKPFIQFSDGGELLIKKQPSFIMAPFFAENRDGYLDIDGIMRPIGRWFIVKNLLIRFWIDYDRVHGSPTVVLKTSERLYKKYKPEFTEFLSSMARNKYGVIFNGSEFELNSDSRSGAEDVFKEFLRYADNEMAIGIWGQNTSTRDDSGSFAESTELRKDEKNIVIEDAKWQDKHINRYWVNPLIKANFSDIDPEWINYVTNKPKTEEWAQTKEKYELAMRSNIAVSRDQFEKEVGIKVKPEEDEDGNESPWITLSMGKQDTNNHNPEIDDLESERRKGQRKDGGSVAE